MRTLATIIAIIVIVVLGAWAIGWIDYGAEVETLEGDVGVAEEGIVEEEGIIEEEGVVEEEGAVQEEGAVEEEVVE